MWESFMRRGVGRNMMLGRIKWMFSVKEEGNSGMLGWWGRDKVVEIYWMRKVS